MDIIIVGAGAAGLMAAKTLTEAGVKVCILEARGRLGGRIYTFNDPMLNIPVDAGAEFIHGNLDVTLALLKEAGINTIEMQGDLWQVFEGKWGKENSFLEDEALLLSKLKALKDNISIAEFLKREFADDKYAEMRQSLLGYVEGYYAGEPDRTSALAFLNEWESEDEQQYRPENGYAPMIHYMAQKVEENGGEIRLSTSVTEIRWKQSHVEIVDENYEVHIASKVIVTVPLGVLTAGKDEKGFINFIPGVPQKLEAAQQMGYGAAIKILLIFDDIFWETKGVFNDRGNVGFIVSDAGIRTWWTQNPVHVPLLTGWLAGPKAESLKNSSPEIIFEQALDSLSYIFNMSKETLTGKLLSWHVFNWTADPFTRGAYAYSTMQTNEARKVLMQPIENTLFFAGEALYDGPEMGTVEAALSSGLNVGNEVLKTMTF